MASNTPYQIINKKPFFLYDNEDVCKWIQSLNLDFYSNVFKSHRITGADLSLLNNEDLKSNMDINNIHDRYTILREIKKLMYSKIKFNLNFDDHKMTINLDYDINITLEKIFPLVCNVLGLSKSVWDRVIIENNDRELICGYCKIFELVVLYPQKYLNLYIRLIEKGKNINFNNYKNQQQTDYELKTSKSINSAKIDYNPQNIEAKLNFSNSTNDFNKLNFHVSKNFDFNKEKALKMSDENAMKRDDFSKELTQRKSTSGTNEFYSNIRKPIDAYSTRTFEEKSNYDPNNFPYNQMENAGENYRTNTNPNLYESKNKLETEEDVMFRREHNDDLKIEKKSRPLSVNNYSSRYLKRDEENYNDQRNIIGRENGFINEQHKDIRNKYNYNNSENNYRLSNKRLDLEKKYSTSNIKNVEKRNLDENYIRNYSNNENFLNNDNNRNYTSNINDIASLSPSTNNIPETNFNYDSNSFKKYNNLETDKINLDNQNIPEFNKLSHNFTAPEGNMRPNPSSDLKVNNHLDEIIDISKYNYQDNKYNFKNENILTNNPNVDSFNPQSNTSKVRYLSERRMFRDKKDDQKNLINNLKKYQQEHKNLKNKYTNINNQMPNENTDSVSINRSNNIAHKNSSNYVSSNLTRSTNYVDNYRDNYKNNDIDQMGNANEKNFSNQYRDAKIISDRSNPSFPTGNLNEKNYNGNTQRDIKDVNSNKEILDDQRKNGDSYSIRSYKDNVNIISDRYGTEKNNNVNSYGNIDDRRINDDYSNSKNSIKDLNKNEVSKSNINNNNNNFGAGSSTKLEKNGKGIDKVKFSNINNLEFFNQKYYK